MEHNFEDVNRQFGDDDSMDFKVDRMGSGDSMRKGAWENRRFSDQHHDQHYHKRGGSSSDSGCCCCISCLGSIWATRQMTDKENKEVYIRTTLRELIFYLLFLADFCAIIFLTSTPHKYFFSNAVRDLFLDTPYPDTRNSLRHSASVADFWRFTEGVLLEGLFFENYYDQTGPPVPLKDRNILHENYIIGILRMTQKRARDDSCVIPGSFGNIIKLCFGSFNEQNEDRMPFQAKTSPGFTFQNEGDPFWGLQASYGKGRFYEDLCLTNACSKKKIEYLKKNLWVDRGTRVVTFDFTVYNANLNYFCVVKIIIEFPPSGGIVPSWTFRSERFIRYVSRLDYFLLACEFLFCFFIAYYIIEEILEIGHLRFAYFKSIWNILDLLVIVLAILLIFYNIYNYLTIEKTLERLMAYPDKYPDFDELGYWQLQFDLLVATCIFFCWFKLFKYISFNKTMTQLTSTLSRSAKDVAGFAVMFFIVFFAFAQLGYLLFGTQVYDFHTFFDSVFTLLRTILGDFNFREIEQANRVLGPIFFLAYVFFVFFVLLNMFLAIINDTYGEVKSEIAKEPNEFEVMDYFLRGYNNMKGKMGHRDKIIDLQNALKTAQKNKTVLKCDEIKSWLTKCNFSNMEIDMFFTIFDTDNNGLMDQEEQKYLYKFLNNPEIDLDNIPLRPKDDDSNRPVSASTRSLRSRQGSKASICGVPPEEIEALSQKIENMEFTIFRIADMLQNFGKKTEDYQNSIEKKKLIMEDFYNKLEKDDDDDDDSENENPFVNTKKT